MAGGRFTESSGNQANLNLAELFDPTTGNWTRAAPMLVPRSGQTATLLPDGQVLIIGGGSLSAELYDLGSNTWTAVSVPPELRRVVTATLLPNGKVLITGVFGPEDAKVDGAALYDPTTDSWLSAAPMKTPRKAGQTATLLPNGRVLVLGGWTSEQAPELPVHEIYTVFNTAEEYDANSNTWLSASPMKQARAYQSATLLPEGNVLVIGGLDEVEVYPFGQPSAISTEIYDPATNSWTALASMPVSRGEETVTLLPEGDVLVVGGEKAGTSSSEVYDPSTNTWAFTAPVMTADGHTATLMSDGVVLVAGGYWGSANMRELSNAEVYASKYPPDEPEPAVPGTTAAATATPQPIVTHATQSHKTWREGNSLASLARKSKRAPVGTMFSFTLNEPASVNLTFTQLQIGREVDETCVARTNKNRHKHTCIRSVTQGVLSVTGHAGANDIDFQGRLSHSKRLASGSYTLLLAATNVAGRSPTEKLEFTIVK